MWDVKRRRSIDRWLAVLLAGVLLSTTACRPGEKT
jgi:hypothetical protein